MRFQGADRHTEVTIQELRNGVRALVLIDGPEAPERFEFNIGGGVTSLTLAADGGVNALDSSGGVVAMAPAPWAVDAAGRSVPTHYEVSGTTLVQVVEHRASSFTYGIVADPSFWAVAKCVAAITWVLGSSLFAVTKIAKVRGAIRALGGIRETAKLLLSATSWREKIAALGTAGAGAAAYFLGISTIVDNC
ncbi:MAG: hypothetical protein ACRCYU_07035 [Nocardioides sp.]